MPNYHWHMFILFTYKPHPQLSSEQPHWLRLQSIFQLSISISSANVVLASLITVIYVTSFETALSYYYNYVIIFYRKNHIIYHICMHYCFSRIPSHYTTFIQDLCLLYIRQKFVLHIFWYSSFGWILISTVRNMKTLCPYNTMTPKTVAKAPLIFCHIIHSASVADWNSF